MRAGIFLMCHSEDCNARGVEDGAQGSQGPPENTMQRYMTVHVTCQNHVGYMTFNISDMHFDMSEHFEHVVCHDSTCNLPCSTTNEDVFAP